MAVGREDGGSAEQAIRVEIYNQTYSIRSDGDNEYIQKLADYVDSKMRDISSGTLTVDSLKVAILAAIFIADELHQHSTSISKRTPSLLAKCRMHRDARPHPQAQGRCSAGTRVRPFDVIFQGRAQRFLSFQFPECYSFHRRRATTAGCVTERIYN